VEVFFARAGLTLPWPLLVLLGLLMGTMQGFFGVGGGWLATPTLNILGFPMVQAIGTGLAYTAGTGVVGSWRHYRLGNLRLRSAALIGVCGMAGVEAARRIVFALEAQGVLDAVVRLAYIILLFGVGTGTLWTVARQRRGRDGGQHMADAPVTPLARWVQGLALPPTVAVSESAAVSVWVLGLVGLSVGFVAGFLGAGGGFIYVPLLVYVVGFSTRAAVAASLLAVSLTNGFGTLSYGAAGRVELLAAGILFAGSVVGAQLGAVATMRVHGGDLQGLLALALLAAGGAVVLQELGLTTAAAVLLFATMLAVSGVILGIVVRKRG
jgi:hypothetical protein